MGLQSVSTLATECVRCPECLGVSLGRTDSCVPGPLRWRDDCKWGRSLCERRIYQCPDSGVFFSHPPMNASELQLLYAESYHAQVDSTERSARQHDFVRATMGELGPSALVVEVGCSKGTLLSLFAGMNRTLVCFEPTASPMFHGNLARRAKTPPHRVYGTQA